MTYGYEPYFRDLISQINLSYKDRSLVQNLSSQEIVICPIAPYVRCSISSLGLAILAAHTPPKQPGFHGLLISTRTLHPDSLHSFTPLLEEWKEIVSTTQCLIQGGHSGVPSPKEKKNISKKIIQYIQKKNILLPELPTVWFQLYPVLEKAEL